MSTDSNEVSTDSGPAETGTVKVAKTAKASSTAKGGRSATALALVAILLALACSAVVGWLWQQLQLNNAEQATASSLQRGLAAADERTSQIQADLAQQLAASQGWAQNLSDRLASLEQENLDLVRQMSALGEADRTDWHLAEIEYLLRLAHQRVMMGGELAAAESLLETADNLLHGLQLSGLMAVRQQVAQDLALVRAAAAIDTEGLYLRLAALQVVAEKLAFFGMPEVPQRASMVTTEETLEPWYQRIYIALKDLMQQLVVVQSRDVPVQSLLAESQQALVRARLALLFQQARTALLLSQQQAYQRALADAGSVIETYYLPDDRATESVLASIAELGQLEVVVQLPDISESQRAIRGYIDAKFLSREQQAPLGDGEQTP